MGKPQSQDIDDPRLPPPFPWGLAITLAIAVGCMWFVILRYGGRVL